MSERQNSINFLEAPCQELFLMYNYQQVKGGCAVLRLDFSSLQSYYREQIDTAVQAPKLAGYNFGLNEADHVVHCLVRSSLEPVGADSFWQVCHGRGVQQEVWHHIHTGQRAHDSAKLGDQVLVLAGIVKGVKTLNTCLGRERSRVYGSMRQNLLYSEAWYVAAGRGFYRSAAQSTIFCQEDRRLYESLARNFEGWVLAVGLIPEQQHLLRFLA